MVPSLARVLGLGALLIYRLRTTPLPVDPEGALAALEAAVAGLGTVATVATLVVAVLAGAVRVYGLAVTHEITVGQALGVVVVTTLVGFCSRRSDRSRGEVGSARSGVGPERGRPIPTGVDRYRRMSADPER